MAEQNHDAEPNGKAEDAKSAKTKSEDAIALLKSDHRKVEQLFESYEKASRRAEKKKLAMQICQELIVHTKLEEEIFYPSCRDHIDDEPLDEAQVEHDGAKVLINELLTGSPGQPFYDAKFKVLSEMIKHHVNEEEKRNEGIFARAKAGGVDTDEIAQRLTARKAELLAEAEQNGPERPRPRSFTSPMQNSMAQGQYRERDDRGRFMSDDDYDDRRSSSRARGGSRYEDYDDDRRGRGRNMPERDEYGRFMSDNNDGSRSGGRARYDDDDDRGRGGGRGRGGWFGDSEGHSMAARQRGDRSRYDDDDDGRARGGWFGDSEGHSEASRRGWRNSDHEGSGWYGESERHSQASRRGWERSDHEGSGWYGDPEGHSQASRRGWESRSDSGSRTRSRYDDDDRRGRGNGGRAMSARGGNDRGRSRDDDDDDRGGRSGRGRGQGGWFGDSEGHSEAARRGWENRQ